MRGNMKVEKNISIYMGEDPTGERRQMSAQQSGKESGKAKNNTTIYAGALNGDCDAIMLKKQMAQKKAMKVVSDAFAADRKLDGEIRDRESKIKKMTEENQESEKAIRELEAQKVEIGKEYGRTEEGLADEDRKILEKNSISPMLLSDEEVSRLQELEEQGLKEYYDRCVEIDDYKKTYQDVIDENTKKIKEYQSINKSIKDARLDLKNNPMVAAGKEAEQILESARQEVIGMLVAEGKDHIDEEKAEREEKAQETKEEKEEQEEKLEAVKEMKAQMQEMVDASRERSRENEKRAEELINSMPIQELIQMDGIKTDVQQEIEDILNKMKLLEEDIKGSAVDTSL